MKIYDISQELLSCEVYPGDPTPSAEAVARIADGDICNLSTFSMCAHNGTHIDAPFHFFNDKNPVDKIALERFIGPAYVADHIGKLTGEDTERIIEKALSFGNGCDRRILIKGDAWVSLEAARCFAAHGVYLVGNESQTVGEPGAPMAVHKVLLSADTVLLEGIRLTEVSEGAYMLNASPINISGFDGAPCRAILTEIT